MVSTKKMVNLKEKDDTILVIVILIGLGFLLLNYTGLPTGAMSRVNVEKELHTQLNAGMNTNYNGYQVELIAVTSNGDSIVSVDGGEPKIAWTSGCAYDDVGTFIGSGLNNEYGIPYGLNVKVCSSSYSRQEADLDFSL